MGPSGSGKSTLMHILAGLDTPDRGQVIIDGVDITSPDDKELTLLRRDKIGFVFQFFNLLPMLTAEENIELPLRHRRAARSTAPGDTSWSQPSAWPTARTTGPSELSGGQQQRVAIARALIDAPARALRRRADGQPRLQDQRRDPRRCCAARSTSSARRSSMVTHDPRAAAIADRVVFLSDGLIVRRQGRARPDEILDVMKALE